MSGLAWRPDQIFEALGAHREALEAHSIALKELDSALICLREVDSKADIAWRLYRISDLEAAEAESSRVLVEAEKRS